MQAPQEIQDTQEQQDYQDSLLKPKEAAVLLGITTQTLRDWNRKGVLSAVHTAGNHLRIPASEINRLLNRSSRVADVDAVTISYEDYMAEEDEPPVPKNTNLARLFQDLEGFK